MRRKTHLNRRQFIGALGTGVAITGCAGDPTIPFLPPGSGEPSPDSSPVANTGDSSPQVGTGVDESEVLAGALYPGLDTKTILLNRITYGPTAADVAEINRVGYMAYVEAQLNYSSINDSQVNAMLAAYPSLLMTPATMSSFAEESSLDDLTTATILRAIYSKRQLFEKVVEFWNDHFNVSGFTGNTARYKVIADRDVIRANAMGRFKDLLMATAKSPAMLRFLDNERSRVGRPNENYARELMELHTLGVSGGYVQSDVQDLARALTGWTIGTSGASLNAFQYRSDLHDNAAKRIMTLILAANGGITDGERAIDFLATHPTTARFIAGKLVAHFVSEDRPASLVDQATTTFRLTNGDIKATLRSILSDSSMRLATAKVKRPFQLFVDVARRSGATPVNPNVFFSYIRAMGHRPFAWSTPDGYPQQSNYWAPGLLPRWNILSMLAGGQVPCLPISAAALAQANAATTPDRIVALWDSLFFGTKMPAADKQALIDYIQRQPSDNYRKYVESLALALSLPAFQTY